MKLVIAKEELPDNHDLEMIHERIDELAQWYGGIKHQLECLQDWIALMEKGIDRLQENRVGDKGEQ